MSAARPMSGWMIDEVRRAGRRGEEGTYRLPVDEPESVLARTPRKYSTKRTLILNAASSAVYLISHAEITSIPRPIHKP